MSKSSILQQSPAFDIDVVALNQQFSRHIESLFQRDEVLHDLASSMLEKGFTYNLVFEQILGIRNIENAAIRKKELQECFHVLDFKLEPEAFDAFFASFTDGSEELIQVVDILKEAKRLNAGVDAQAKKGQTNIKVQKAQRRFHLGTRVKEFIGEKIVEHKMKFFGFLLKGQDFDYDEDDEQ